MTGEMYSSVYYYNHGATPGTELHAVENALSKKELRALRDEPQRMRHRPGEPWGRPRLDHVHPRAPRGAMPAMPLGWVSPRPGAAQACGNTM